MERRTFLRRAVGMSLTLGLMTAPFAAWQAEVLPVFSQSVPKPLLRLPVRYRRMMSCSSARFRMS